VQDDLTAETTLKELKIEERALSYTSQTKEELPSHPAPGESIVQQNERLKEPMQQHIVEETKI